MSQTTSIACPACGTLNDVLVPDDSFAEQLQYAALQFACRACGASLRPEDDKEQAAPPSGKR